MAQTRFAQTVRPFVHNADLPGLRVAMLPARASPPAVLSGLMAGGGRVCRLVAGMGRGRSGFFLSVERRIVTGNDKK